MKRSSRAIALKILETVSGRGGGFAAERVHEACREHSLAKRDRRFLTELVYGVLRHRLTLDRIVAAYSKMPLGEVERRVLQSLRLGVYQLLFLDGVPPFAAIGESVKALGGPARGRSFANGVLRAIDRDCRRVSLEDDRGGASPRKRLVVAGRKVCFFSRPVFADPESDAAGFLAEVFSCAPFLVSRWLERFGRDATEAMLERNNQPPPLFARANRRHGTQGEILERLHREGLRCIPGNRDASIRVLAPPTELLLTRTFREGGCSVQDETAMAVAPRLGAEPGMKVLDACAAPGGKTTHLAELTDDAAVIVAVDRDGRRLGQLHENLARLGLRSVRALEMDLLNESEELPAAELGPPYDRILLDAPCSNSGVLARRPEARYRITPESLGSLSELQHQLLEKVASWLRPGGGLLYSTCSVEEAENQAQVERFLAAHGDYRLEVMEETLPAPDGGDGGFCALLRREAGSQA